MTRYDHTSRRRFLKGIAGMGAVGMFGQFVTGCAASTVASPREEVLLAPGPEVDLKLARQRIEVAGQSAWATTINGGIPGPVIRLKEGQDVILRVENLLEDTSSIHWHGLLVPYQMDGVPGVSFEGISPGETFEYTFPIRQSGTYWYHSHSGFQEQTGIYGAIVVDPAEPSSYGETREHVVVLSDWTFEDPRRVYTNLKKYGGYYNFQRQTLANLGAHAARTGGVFDAIRERFSWARMRMDQTDLSDVTGITYTYLMNGLSPGENWHGLFSPGERVRLRLVNASAATFFDVRIPGLEMTVIEVDGMPVEPVQVDELRIAIAETYDVLVEPNREAYTLFAEAMDRSGFARGTLATTPRASAPIPERRVRPLLTMTDMGMAHGAMGHDMSQGESGGMTHSEHEMSDARVSHGSSMKMEHVHGEMEMSKAPPVCGTWVDGVFEHGSDEHGPGNIMVAQRAKTRLDDPGPGLRDAPWRVLTYGQLRRATPSSSTEPPTREIELHLTGNMERYMWSFDGVQYEAGMPAVTMKKGERVRVVLINDTMMAHPIHLHGMFFELDVGACERNPLKHTVSVGPSERVSFLVTAEEVGRWAFHCHVLYHMMGGMFRVVEVLP